MACSFQLKLTMKLLAVIFFFFAQLLNAFDHVSSTARLWCFIGMAVLLVLYACIPLCGARRSNVDLVDEPLLYGAIQTKSIDDEQSYSVRESLATVQFWLFFFVEFAGTGAALMVINNISQFNAAIDGGDALSAACVSIISAASCLGRLTVGILTHRYKQLPPSLIFCCSMAIMTITQFFFMFVTKDLLPLLSFIVGLCFGSYWSLMPLLSKKMFGIKNLGTIYNIVNFAPMLGSYIFSTQLAGSVYDKYAVKEASGHKVCTGNHCFQLTFTVSSGICLLGFFTCVVLHCKLQKSERQRS